MADYINKQEFLAHMMKTNRYFDVKFDVEDFPSADVAPMRHGKMIEIIEDGAIKRISSCCGTDFTTLTLLYDPAYCPHCGALLDKEAKL